VVGGSNGIELMLKVTVVAISGDRVRLGFEVDPGVPVHRTVVWERIRIAEADRGMQSDPMGPPAT